LTNPEEKTERSNRNRNRTNYDGGLSAHPYVPAKRPEKVTGNPFQEEECLTENLKRLSHRENGKIKPPRGQ
jgi:hypothetical protein